jgi:ketosteroid isomerase-like protein
MNTEQQLQQAADRMAIRNLVDQYAYCADARDAEGQMALFTEDTDFIVFMDAKSAEPSQAIHNRADLFPVFDNLNAYRATMHFNGQSTVLELNDDTATGITYCIAHHQTIKDGVQSLMIAHIKYHDRFVKQNEKCCSPSVSLWWIG